MTGSAFYSYALTTDSWYLAYQPEEGYHGAAESSWFSDGLNVPDGDWTAFVSPYAVSPNSGIGLALITGGEVLEFLVHAQPPADTGAVTFIPFSGRQMTLRIEHEAGVIRFSYSEDERTWEEVRSFSVGAPVSEVGVVLRYDREDYSASGQVGFARLLEGIWQQDAIEERTIAAPEEPQARAATREAPLVPSLYSTITPPVHLVVGAQFGDLEFDVGKSVRWAQWFTDNVFVLDVNLGTPRYWIVNWTETFPEVEHDVTGINYFMRPTDFRREQWARYKAAFGEPADSDWILWIDAHEGLSVDNRTLPTDYAFSPFKSFLWREIQAADDLGYTSVRIPYYVFLRSDNVVNISYDTQANDPGGDIPPVQQSISTPYYQAHQSLRRLWKASELKNPAFDWSQLDVPTAVSGDIKIQIISYGYAHWNLQDIEPPQTTVPPLTAANDDGWRMRNLLSKVRPIPGLPIGDTWVSPASDPVGLPGPWAPADVNNPNAIHESGPYLNPAGVNNASIPDATELNITTDVRFTAKVRDDSVESTTSRIIVGKTTSNTTALSWRFGHTYTTGFNTSAYPTGLSGTQVVVHSTTRSALGLTPAGVDRYVGSILTGVGTTTATTLRGQMINSVDGVTWANVGAQGTAVAANAMSFDSASPLIVGLVWQGRIYWVQAEAINQAQLSFPGVAGSNLTVPDAANLDITGDLEIVAHLDPYGGVWNTVAMEIFNKYLATGNQRSYRFYVGASGALALVLSGDGLSGVNTVTSSANLGGITGPRWVKVTRQGAVVKFFHAVSSPLEPTTWTQLGADRTTTVTGTLFVGTSPGMVGDVVAAVSPYKGRIRQVIVRDGIAGTTVLDINENNAGRMVTSSTFVASTGQTVTVSGSISVQPQPDTLLWRFDASEYDFVNDPTAFTDPRGRTWTLTSAAAMVENTTDTITQPVTPNAALAGLVTPLYDLSLRINMRDGVWYEAGASGNIPLYWDTARQIWTTDYDPATWAAQGVDSYDPSAVP